VEDGEEVLDAENPRSVLNMVLNTIDKEFEHQCLAEAVTPLNLHPIRQSANDHIPGCMYSIPGLPGNMFGRIRLGPSCSLRGDGVEMLICQNH
jgi:hypothetical protein